MERLRGEPEMVDTTNDRGSEGTAEREREREEGKESKRLYKIINYIVLIPSSGVKTETVSENGPRPTSVLAAIVNS